MFVGFVHPNNLQDSLNSGITPRASNVVSSSSFSVPFTTVIASDSSLGFGACGSSTGAGFSCFCIFLGDGVWVVLVVFSSSCALRFCPVFDCIANVAAFSTFSLSANCCQFQEIERQGAKESKGTLSRTQDVSAQVLDEGHQRPQDKKSSCPYVEVREGRFGTQSCAFCSSEDLYLYL